MNILITGACGFIGSFIVEEALRQGMNVWAAMRKTSSKRYLTDSRINFIELNLDSQKELTEQLTGLNLDYVVHAAGATKCLRASDFNRDILQVDDLKQAHRFRLRLFFVHKLKLQRR